MKKHTILLCPLGKEISVNHGTPLVDVLHEFGIEFPCGGMGTCGKCRVKLVSGNIELTPPHQLKISRLGLSAEWRLACMSECTEDITLEVDQFSHVILADETTFKFEPQEGYGIAVDLGTTTIVSQLISLRSAEVLEVETLLNPQQKFGADLISRIQTCLEGHALEMTLLIRSAIGTMIDRMLDRHPVPVKEVVLVGNTVMHHIFCGIDVAPLATYPFLSQDTDMKTFSPGELGWESDVRETIRFYPSIGSFVGSDILAGIASTGMHQKEKITALIDLGTNGEIAIGNSHRIVCASTAAGPAFEGAVISMGMQAVTGALSSIRLSGEKMEYNVIGKTTPKGICGSALIDAVAVLRWMKLIGTMGEIVSGQDHIRLTGKVSLTQRDLYEFLLAKAALAAGMTILARQLSISVNDISEVYIAGGFGNYIHLPHVVELGMIELPEEKIHKMGNTALIGAKIFLFTDTDAVEDILQKTEHISLESDPDFQDIFVEKMQIPPHSSP
jgi:uncharacterized 2Fe-2S/4Fe-4S cluster protein (DUF4445 family)